MPDEYDLDSIKVLEGLDGIRERPSLYIGNTDDGSGLHNMVYEVVENAIDDGLAFDLKEVLVTLNVDGSVTVADDSHGLPIYVRKGGGTSGAKVIMTQLHAGEEFDQNSYTMFGGGLHSIGVSVVNALSSVLKLTIWRDDQEQTMEFRHGEVAEPLAVVGPAPGRHGTQITFTPSTDIFTMVGFDFATLGHRLRQLALLNSGVAIVLSDKRHAVEKRQEMRYESGVEGG